MVESSVVGYATTDENGEWYTVEPSKWSFHDQIVEFFTSYGILPASTKGVNSSQVLIQAEHAPEIVAQEVEIEEQLDSQTTTTNTTDMEFAYFQHVDDETVLVGDKKFSRFDNKLQPYTNSRKLYDGFIVMSVLHASTQERPCTIYKTIAELKEGVEVLGDTYFVCEVHDRVRYGKYLQTNTAEFDSLHLLAGFIFSDQAGPDNDGNNDDNEPSPIPPAPAATNQMKIGIIGTAGRKKDAVKLDMPTYEKMYERLLVELDRLEPDVSKRHLVSGGAAWADHLAVLAYLDGKAASLSLHLPARYSKDYGVLGYYHQAFCQKLGHKPRYTLDQINEAIEKGAQVTYYSDQPQSSAFKERNNAVANMADALLAFTFNAGSQPKPGGTKDTWNKHSLLHPTRTRKHIDIASLEFIYKENLKVVKVEAKYSYYDLSVAQNDAS